MVGLGDGRWGGGGGAEMWPAAGCGGGLMGRVG